MGVKVSNNAFGTLSASINTSDTTITLDSGQGARFPSLGASEHFYGTLIDTSNNIEIVKVTARSTDSMTVTRAQDDTTATAFAIGDRFELRPTAALFEDIITEIGNVDLSSRVDKTGDTMTGSLGIRGTSTGRFGTGISLKGAVPELHLKRDDGNGEAGILLDNASSTKRMYVGTYNSTDETHIGTNGTQRLIIDSSGRVTIPNQPGFLARRSIAGDGRSAGSITEWSVTGTGSYNTGSHFSTSTGRFTAPVAGTYAFAANPGYLQTNVTFNWYWQVNGSNICEGVRFIGGLSSHSTGTGAIFAKLAVNDYVSIYIGTTHHVNVSFNTFSGILIG